MAIPIHEQCAKKALICAPQYVFLRLLLTLVFTS